MSRSSSVENGTVGLTAAGTKFIYAAHAAKAEHAETIMSVSAVSANSVRSARSLPLFGHDRRIGRALPWRRVEILAGAQHDLIELHAVFAHLDAHRVRPGGRERHSGRLREPVRAVHPSPPVEARPGAVGGEIDQQSGRRADRIAL